MIRAFAAGLAVAVVAPMIGTFLVVKRFSLIADTLAHIALTGVAVALITRTNPVAATVAVTVIASVVIERLRSTRRIPGEAILAMFLPGGLALSIILVALARGINANLFAYLFGSISTVQSVDLALIVGLAVLAVVSILLLYKQLFFAAVDEESAKIRGVNTGLVNNILVILTAVTVSVAMRVVGVLLVGALMVIPAVTAMQIARSFAASMAWSVALAVVAVVAGLWTAYYLSLPAGATIVLVSLTIFIIVAWWTRKS